MDAHFVKDLGLDSLDAVEIVMAFEDEFGTLVCIYFPALNIPPLCLSFPTHTFPSSLSLKVLKFQTKKLKRFCPVKMP